MEEIQAQVVQPKIKMPNRQLFSWSLREIRQGQLWPISAALTLIIACIFALTALADRMEQVIVKQGKDALTADSVFVSANPIPELLLGQVRDNNLETTTLTRFATMAFSDEDMQLVTVKAVGDAYPLRGELILTDESGNKSSVSQGELWLEQRVMDQLNVNIGDSVTIGDADLQVTGVITEEPGLSFNPFQQMPSVMINSADIEKTGALQIGSRVQFRLFLNGDSNAIQSIVDSTELTPSDRWLTENTQSRTSDVFSRTKQYLSLTVAIVILMAATTLVLTCQHYVSNRRQTIAMLKSIGASKSWIARWLWVQLGVLFAIGITFGIAIGIGLEVLLRLPMADLLPDPLPSYGISPYLYSVVTCVLISVPALGIPLLHLLNTPALSVMQDSALKVNRKSLLLLLVPVIPMLVVYGSNLMVWMVLVGIVVLFAVLGLVSSLLTRLVSKLPMNTTMKLAVSRLNRTSVASGVQFAALALSLMLLSVIWLVRTDLLSDWQQTLPDDAPNVFALNIASTEVDSYLTTLDENVQDRSEAYPIIRGRVSTINGIPAKDYVLSKRGAEEETDALSRELNFTWADQIPAHNDLLEGEWVGKGSVSVESDVMSELGLEIGDTLTYVINGVTVEAKVDSVRHVEWREMKPNFYFIFSPDVLESIPSTYLVSFRINDEQKPFLNQLSRSYPTVSVMDISTMGAKIQELLRQIVWAITVLAALGVIAGLMLIFTLLRLSLSQRQQEIRLYRTLGASKKRISNTLWCEFGLMAIIAGIIASFGAEVSVASLMKWGFELTPNAHPWLWLILPVLSFATLGLVLNTLIKRLLIPVNKGAY
ncbi:putative ABC-type transport system involved in lysophospholipase L1 biosynthesis, permease component [Vibrio nigripulchritudo SO65]|uniref:ABC transporter permease n=1 Tax=Vibrio nigripulchritudo TaxID=28173 RepID=UPI0003B240FC|nr:ABC transporter permease [Vibrio nigripulchritudo]CCN35620.1 putative ABC-type transport system involved in lysophospholipase L1 biosynthesis, permease component [Vibrio nigripulchritudo AM115]CCN44507.1 putative ABC-type transport system involved in lysophospholipase L1 biosynthesis, permease component [Vibrio nigripulchritudo FTn2]CCN67790.1 putative ABC-type transport system involved in lysophospholipase L1 biosynthesis, permease component [Vibrio nigripulchritudo POn4]CCN77184.1 putative